MSRAHEVQVHKDGGLTRLILRGEIDLDAVPELAARSRAALAEHPERLVIDLSETTFLDSSGVGALVALRNSALEVHSTQILLRPGPANVMRILEIVGLADVFELTT